MKQKKETLIFFILCIFLCLSNGYASPIKVLGIDIASSYAYNLISSLTNIEFTKVSTTAFSTVNLYDYDVLFVAETFKDGGVSTYDAVAMNALKSRESDIESWMRAGHGIVALSEPLGPAYDWLPDAIQPATGSCVHRDNIVVVDTTHPVLNNLTSSSLSGWGSSSHGNFLNSGGLDVLTTDGSGNAITLAGTLGSGRVVLTLQDPHWHNPSGRPDIVFVQNMLDWASLPVPEPDSFIMLAISLSVLFLFVQSKK